MLSKWLIIVVCMYFYQTLGVIGLPCTIQIKQQFGRPSPMPLNRNSIAAPASGVISVNPGDILELFCSEHFDSSVPGGTTLSTIPVKCVTGQLFEVPAGAKAQNIITVKCKKPSKSDQMNVHRIGDLEYSDVGFEISGSWSIPIYSVLFNTITEGVMYSNYTMTKAIDFSHTPSRPLFIQDPCFSCPCSELYKRTTQLETICGDLLNVPTNSQDCQKWFGTSTTTGQKYLAKGHLAANAEFVYEFEQRATFRLCNAAPQWQVINNGNWKALESGVRRFVISKGITVDIYTGTRGQMEIYSPTKGQNIKISLEKTGKVPVPMFFYKVVIDKQAQRGIAFVTLNNPYLTVQDIERNYIFCTDISSRIGTSWSSKFGTSDFKNPDKGYTYACEVGDFMNAVTDLPKDIRSDVVNGLLI